MEIRPCGLVPVRGRLVLMPLLLVINTNSRARDALIIECCLIAILVMTDLNRSNKKGMLNLSKVADHASAEWRIRHLDRT